MNTNSSLLDNPILQRELSGRWRRSLTPLILFFYAALFAGAMYWVYVWQVQITLTIDKSSGLGQRLFASLSGWQLILSCLLVTTISASSITVEKELDLWSTLRLSLLSAREISIGKFSASIGFMLLVICVPLPLCAILLLLGGISMVEFSLMALVQMTSVLFFGALATAISASSRTTGTAFGKSLLFSALLLPVPSGVVSLLGDITFAAAVIGYVMIGLGLTAFLVLKLTPARIEKTEHQKIRRAKKTAQSKPMQVAAVGIGVMANSPKHNAEKRRSTRPPIQDGPLGERLRFANPILQRELRTLLRRWCGVSANDLKNHAELTFAFWVPAMMIYGTALWLVDADTRTLLFLLPIIWTVFTALKTASLSFMRDRNQGILKPMLMTQMTPRDIIWGKLQAALIMAAMRGVLFVPLVIVCFSFAPWYMTTVCLAVLTLIWISATSGLLCSWFCEGPAIALSGAGALVFGCSAAALQLVDARSPLRYLLKLHPLTRWVGPLLSPVTPGQWLMVAVGLSMLFFVLGILALIPIELALRPAVLEKDSVSIMTKDLSKAL